MAKRQMKRLYYGRIKVPARLAKSEEQVFVAGDSFVNLYRMVTCYHVAMELKTDATALSFHTVVPTYRAACIALVSWANVLDQAFPELAKQLFACFEEN